MRLSSLALRNIRRSALKYMMHFLSLSFSVFTVYSFLALMYNEQVGLAFTYDDRYRSMLLAFAVIIGVFVLFFLISSNNSFIKSRKKEISTYALFGMKPMAIGLMLFMETMIVGGAALLLGIGSGVFYSRLIAMILLDISLTSFAGTIAFSLAPQAVYYTVAPFIFAFGIMGLSGLRVINSFELVDLFKANKLGEHSARGSVVMLILSLLLIGAGYYLASNNRPQVVVVMSIPILLLVISGTYLFFVGGLPKVIGLLKKNRARYYRGVNLISLSTFSHRVNTIGAVMASIAILSAVATTAIATGFTLYQNVERNTYKTVGYDLSFWGGDSGVLTDIEQAFQEHGIRIEGHFSTGIYHAQADTDPIMIDDRLLIGEETVFQVYSQSIYNRLASMAKSEIDTVDLDPGEMAYIFPRYPFIEEDVRQVIIGHELAFGHHIYAMSDLVVSGIPSWGITHALVVHDEDFSHLLAAGQLNGVSSGGEPTESLSVINYENALRSADVNNQLAGLLQGRVTRFRSAHTHYIESMETFGLVCFIGFFMSVVFILMTASLLYFKQIVAAEEEKHQYVMLRKIGMESSVEGAVIARRLLPVFFVPLVVGIVHSVFAMKTADTVVFTNMIPVANSYLVVLRYSGLMYALYALIYSIFYLITKQQYGRRVRSC